LKINFKATIRILVLLTAVFAFIHLLLMLVNYAFSWVHYEKFAKIFHLNAEQSIPTYFSSVLLLISSLLLYLIAQKSPANVKKWKLLSLIFLMMSIDETVSLHEKLIPLVRNIIGVNPYFYWGWTIPAIIGIAIFGGLFFKFWKGLPPDTRTGMMWAGIIYVAGALGLELFESFYFYRIQTYRDIWLDLLFGIEEILEMGGIILFISVLASHIQEHLSLKDIKLT
jgi:hypothetical protein